MDTTKPVLVAYASDHGATREIAEHIGRTLTGAGLSVEVEDAGEVEDLAPYGAAIIGSAVYMGRWRGSAKRLAKRHERELSERDVWLFSSGPVGEPPAADDEKAEKFTHPKFAIEEAEKIGAHEHVVFGGRVPDEGFIAKSMRKSIPPELQDLRDWDEIGRWAEGVAATLGATRAAAGQRGGP